MSVIVKGMDMPESCGKCFVGNREICVNGCPLIPVPQHGRLIDADAFENFIRKDWDKNDHWIADVVYSRPTIIEAEEGER